MDGFSSTRKIRSFEKANGLAPIPIIALTAGISKDDKLRCKEAGMDHYLTKPFTISELTDALKYHIRSEFRRQTSAPNLEEMHHELDLVHPASNRDVVNISAVNNIREIEKQTGKSILPSILKGFEQQMNTKLTEINDSLKNREIDTLYRTAHAIKSMSANIGAEKVRSISAQIEGQAKDGKWEGVEKKLATLSDAYEEFLKEFRMKFIA